MTDPRTPAELKSALKATLTEDGVIIDGLILPPEFIDEAINELIEAIENVYVGVTELTPCQVLIGKIFLNRLMIPLTQQVEATVRAIIPEYHQVKAVTNDGMICTLTRKTEGIDISTLQEDQRLRCKITTRLARVISAELIQDLP